MNSMAVESESYFPQAAPASSSSADVASTSATAMEIDTAERSRTLPSVRDTMPEASAGAFTWGYSASHLHHHHHNHHPLSQYDTSSSSASSAAYIATPAIFATPFAPDPAGDYFGNATAADAAGGASDSSSTASSPAGQDFFTAAQTPSAFAGAIGSTTASLPPSVLQRFQAAARHSPGIVLPPRTPAPDQIESFAASSPSYFPDPSQTTTTTNISSSSSSVAATAAPSSSSSFFPSSSSSSSTHPSSTRPPLPHTSSFQLPPTPFMPPAPHARHGGASGGVSGPDMSWVPYPPSSRTNPLPNRRSTTHLSLSAPLNMPSVSTLQKPVSAPRPLHRHSTINLPPATELEPADPAVAAQWIKSATESNGTQRNVMLLDMRPSVNYAAATIRNAISISVPNMLLKRPMFSLAMVMDQLTSDRELAVFADWKQYSNLVFFDASGAVPVVGSPTFCMVQKFQREGCSAKLWYLQGGYNAFAPNYPDLLQIGSDDASSSKGLSATATTASSSLASVSSSSSVSSSGSSSSSNSSASSSSAPSAATTPSLSSVMSPPRQRLHLGSLPTMMTTPMAGPLACQTPMIENPNVNPLFESVRQAMGLNTAITEEIPVRLPKGFSVDTIRQHLPPWLLAAVDEEHGKTMLAEGFQKVEVNEQKRLALLMLPQAMRAGRTIGYSIGAGIEKGLKNRYNNIWPYDHSRVRIGECAANSDDYINASFVQAPFGKKSYIATQGPLPQTFLDFWKVAWEQDVRVVVMLTRELEMGRLKCHQYWPTKDAPVMDLDGVAQVRFVSESIPDAYSPTVLVRHLMLKHCGRNEERAIAQIQYSGWPDFGVPQTPMDVLRVVNLANHFNEDKPTRPMIVHCSAGCGRTGAFCAIDSVLDEYQHNPEGLQRFANGPAPPPSVTLYQPSSLERNVLEELRARPTAGVNERVNNLMSGHQGSSGTGAGQDALSNGAGSLQEDAGRLPSRRDVIYETVSVFREQRMSMVQTLRHWPSN
ncbi:hypothetical protein BGZ73_005534 [Actinomortierella ambigua]|nr:hypothetical protein BGZ73_005534 [Actinomortierella ambigua]